MDDLIMSLLAGLVTGQKTIDDVEAELHRELAGLNLKQRDEAQARAMNLTGRVAQFAPRVMNAFNAAHRKAGVRR